MPTSTARRKKKLSEECFRLLREISLKREPNCVICPRLARDPHHFIKRSLCKHLQLDLENIVSLCGVCHSRLEWTDDPEMIDKIKQARPEGWAEKLYERRHTIIPSFWTMGYLAEKKKELEDLLR